MTTPYKTKRAINDFKRPNLPRVCASMKDLESWYGIPAEFQRLVRRRGLCPEAFETGNRVQVVPLFRFIGKLLADKPNVLDMEGVTMLDPAQEKALLDKAKREQVELDNAEKRGELCSRDGVEAELGPHLETIAAGWRKIEKETGAKIRALLTSFNVPTEAINQVVAMMLAGVDEPLEAVRQFLEKKEE